MAAKLPIAQARMFANVFICKECNKRIRSQATRIIAGKVRCPKCKSHHFRPIKRK